MSIANIDNVFVVFDSNNKPIVACGIESEAEEFIRDETDFSIVPVNVHIVGDLEPYCPLCGTYESQINSA